MEDKKENDDSFTVHIATYSKKIKKSSKPLFKLLKLLGVGILLFLISGFFVGIFGSLGLYFKYSYDFSKTKPQSNSTQLVMYDKDGDEIFRGFGAEEPSRVKLSDIPENVKNATLAAEDANFYTHGAVDFRGLARAIYVNFQDTPGGLGAKVKSLFSEGNYATGGSTITQQLVKNVYLTSERSFDRKLKEALFAYKLENKYSKDQILEMYLNEIYYGEQALGIKNAAKIYFGKDLKDLDLAEASMLAGLPQAPSYYDPMQADASNAKKRQEYVLQQMIGAKMITMQDAKAAANEDLTYVGSTQLVDKYPYFDQYVKDELSDKLGNDQVANRGLHVYTTLDPEKQKIAETQAVSWLGKLAYRGATNASVVVADPKTNSILAMVGGTDWNRSKVNVSTSLRQPGSSFKPLVYATAFEGGYTAATILNDKYVNFGGNPPYIPRNYSGGYSGYQTARNALARSLNTTAVETGKLAGIENIINTAHKLGITSLNDGAQNYGLPLALGSGEVRLVDMVNAYSAFANKGRRMNNTSITKIINNRGEEIALPGRNTYQAISPETAYIISSILSDNNARSATFGSVSPLKTDKVTAVKTGTTDNYSDSWTVGYTPDLVVGVWMGNNDHKPMRNISGVEGAAYVWHDVITQSLASVPSKDFEKPDGIKDVWVNPYTGGIATYQGAPNILEHFKNGTEPKTARPDLTYLKQF